LLRELIHETLADHLVQPTAVHVENCRHCQEAIEQWLDKRWQDDGGQNDPAKSFAIPGYAINAEVGRGGMGIVYRALHQTTGEVVALKVLSPHVMEHSDSLKRFQQEIETLQRLNHPGIVRMIDAGFLGNQPWFSMEFVQGPSLEKFLSNRPQHPLEAAEFMLRVLPALEIAHQSQIIHRDLKPHNILLQPFRNGTLAGENSILAFQPKIVDFGIAKWLGKTTQLTQTGDFIGSLEYMSPEVLLGDSHGDCRSDIYALGVLLYELLVGRTPFRAPTIAEFIRRMTTEIPTPPSRFDNSIPASLEQICLKCLHRAPADRYSSIQDLREDIERFCKGQRIHARPLAWSKRLFMWGKQKPVTFTAIVVGLVSLIVIFSLMLRHQRQLNVEKKQTEDSLRIAIDTAEITFDQFFRLLGELSDDNKNFRAGGIVDEILRKMSVIEKQRPNDVSLQLLLAKLETTRAEEEMNQGSANFDPNSPNAHLEKAKELIDHSLNRTEKLIEGDRKIAALQQHEYSCKLASEIYRSLREPEVARRALEEGFKAIAQLRSAEPSEGKHVCRYLFFLTEKSWQIWDDWDSQRSSDLSMLDALSQYEKNFEQATKQLQNLRFDNDPVAWRAMGSVYEDLAEWHFQLGKLRDQAFFKSALAYNQKAIALAEQEYEFIPTSRNAYRVEKLRMNFCRILRFSDTPDTSWLIQRQSFYQKVQSLAPIAMAGNRWQHLQRAIQYELDVVEKTLPERYFLPLSRWQQLRRQIDETYQSLGKELAESFAADFDNVRLSLDKRIEAGSKMAPTE
jgi:serine/threonine protein kinase